MLFVGTLEPRKNIGTLLDAWTLLVKRLPNLPKLRLVGDARPEAGTWLARLQVPPLAGTVEYVGYIPDASRRDMYTGARLLVLPSWHEGFGLPALEAMALGVPVVASNRGALPEVVGDAGTLVPPDDARGLASAIEAVLSNPARASEMSARGLSRAAPSHGIRRLRPCARRSLDWRRGRRERDANWGRCARTRRTDDWRGPLSAIASCASGACRPPGTSGRSIRPTAVWPCHRGSMPKSSVCRAPATRAGNRGPWPARSVAIGPMSSSRPATRRLSSGTVPLVVAMHDVSFAAHPEWYRWREGLRRRWLSRWAARKARAVITISAFSRDEIVRHLGVPAERMRVIPLGVGLSSTPGRSDERAPLVLFVGSIFNRRHLPALIDGFGRLAATAS